MGLSEAINELARRGLTVKPKRKKWVQKTHSMGTAKVDLTNIGKALEELEGPWHR